MIPRPVVDLDALSPEELRAAPQSLFLRVVDADLKRENRGSATPVPPWVTHALRTEHLDRWVMTLRRMLAQVEGRLSVIDADWEAKGARLSGGAHEDGYAEYRGARLRSERFRAGVTEALAEADSLYDSRLAVLEDAIRTHRDEVEADESIDPSDADRQLWNVLYE